jgi:hypothetical protein
LRSDFVFLYYRPVEPDGAARAAKLIADLL